MSTEEERPEFDTVKLPSSSPQSGKTALEGGQENSDLTPREHDQVLFTLQRTKSGKKGVSIIVLVEPVTELVPVSGFRLDSVWTESICVGELISNKGTFHCEHKFLLVLTFQMFKTMLQQCNFSCR